MYYAALKIALDHMEGACKTDSSVSLPWWMSVTAVVGISEAIIFVPVLIVYWTNMCFSNRCVDVHVKGFSASVHSLLLAWNIVWSFFGVITLSRPCDRTDYSLVEFASVELVLNFLNSVKMCSVLCVPDYVDPEELDNKEIV